MGPWVALTPSPSPARRGSQSPEAEADVRQLPCPSPSGPSLVGEGVGGEVRPAYASSLVARKATRRCHN